MNNLNEGADIPVTLEIRICKQHEQNQAAQDEAVQDEAAERESWSAREEQL